jgi:hypothetical protein
VIWISNGRRHHHHHVCWADYGLLSVCFFCLGVEWGEGEPRGATKGGLVHEDRIWISYVPHRPSRPAIGHDLKQNNVSFHCSVALNQNAKLSLDRPMWHFLLQISRYRKSVPFYDTFKWSTKAVNLKHPKHQRFSSDCSPNLSPLSMGRTGLRQSVPSRHLCGLKEGTEVKNVGDSLGSARRRQESLSREHQILSAANVSTIAHSPD